MKRKNYYHLFILLLGFALCFNSTSFGQQNIATPFPDRIILNLAEDASTSLAVTWRTDLSTTEGFCELQRMTPTRIDPANTKSFKATTTLVKYEYIGLRYVFEGEPNIEANQHSHIFTDLEPGEKYLYRVGKEGFWSEWFEFKMPSSDDSRFSFIYFGDPQADLKSEWSRVVRRAYNYSPECSFMLYGGDIINRAGRDWEWHEWFVAGSYIFATVPQVMTPGNHDYQENLEIDPHWTYQFTQPANGPKEVKNTCFFSDYKNLKIISIDSAIKKELREDENDIMLNSQMAWLDSLLTVNTKEWVIVTTHLPFYSSAESRDNTKLRTHFQPILEKHGVDMVLTGHDHSYARGMVSDFSAKPSIVYVVSVSGPKLYEVGNKEWMKVRGENVQLFQEISIDGKNLHYKAVTADGELFDEFIIKKKSNGKNKFIEKRLK
ncbi:MAG: metallophosphoesterase family protein [Bacteroidales bacterium]|nr:metallophosphoesterase family protein [Bacteroidales bacterium]